jgi:hypothetical protein
MDGAFNIRLVNSGKSGCECEISPTSKVQNVDKTLTVRVAILRCRVIIFFVVKVEVEVDRQQIEGRG